MNGDELASTQRDRQDFRNALARVVSSGAKFKWLRAFMQTCGSALSAAPGGLHAVIFGLGGGAVSAAATVWAETEQASANELFTQCLQQLEKQLAEITALVYDVLNRLDLDDEEIRNRVESEEYQGLVRRAFRDRSTYDTDAKREHLRKLLGNAAFPKVVPDDLIRLFIDWLSRYNDLHFRVMAVLRANPHSTRADTWRAMHGEEVREDSAEADLFACLIMDLSFGHVIRQQREKTSDGHFLKSQTRSRSSSPYMKSRFDDEKEYELTELGTRFIHYVMDEDVKKFTG